MVENTIYHKKALLSRVRRGNRPFYGLIYRVDRILSSSIIAEKHKVESRKHKGGMNDHQKQKIEKFTDLVAWQKGHELVLLIYQLSNQFPLDERFGLTSQVRRAAVSITSNLAEGFGRRTPPDKKRFYDMAMGSVYEIQNQLMIARDIQFISPISFQSAFDLSQDVRFLTISLIQSIP